MAISPNWPTGQTPSAAQRRAVEAWSATIEEMHSPAAENPRMVGWPLMLTIRVGARMTGYFVARGPEELSALACAVCLEWMPLAAVGTVAAAFLEDWFPLGFVVTQRVTGPQIHCWLASKGWIHQAPAEWKWSMSAPFRSRPPDADEIPF